MTNEEQSFSLEALRSLPDEVDVPTERDALNSLMEMLSERRVRQLRKNNKNWAQINGFRDNAVNPRIRELLTATIEKKLQRRKALVFYWAVDHQELLKQVAESVSVESIRDDVLDLLSNGTEPGEIAWALRFNTREEIRDAVDGKLWDELHNEESNLLAQYSLRRLKKDYKDLERQHDELQQKKSSLEERVEELDDDLTTAESTLEEQSQNIDRLEVEIDSLREEKEDLEAELDNRNQALKNAKQELKQQREENRKATSQLSTLQRKMSKAFEPIADVLDVSNLPDDHEDASDVVINHIEELKQECRSLESTVENLEHELDQLAPALPHIRQEWEHAIETFREDVDKQLAKSESTSETFTPADDWEEWLSEERSLISRILDHLEQPREDHYDHVKTIQDLLRLRWYLLEWIRLGLIRHLESTNAVANYLNSSD